MGIEYIGILSLRLGNLLYHPKNTSITKTDVESFVLDLSLRVF